MAVAHAEIARYAAVLRAYAEGEDEAFAADSFAVLASPGSAAAAILARPRASPASAAPPGGGDPRYAWARLAAARALVRSPPHSDTRFAPHLHIVECPRNCLHVRACPTVAGGWIRALRGVDEALSTGSAARAGPEATWPGPLLRAVECAEIVALETRLLLPPAEIDAAFAWLEAHPGAVSSAALRIGGARPAWRDPGAEDRLLQQFCRTKAGRGAPRGLAAIPAAPAGAIGHAESLRVVLAVVDALRMRAVERRRTDAPPCRGCVCCPGGTGPCPAPAAPPRRARGECTPPPGADLWCSEGDLSE
jgi:hypothetical protein